jgi:outer membrane immunogenic protein
VLKWSLPLDFSAICTIGIHQDGYFATFELGLEGSIMRRVSAALAAISIAFSQLASAADLPRKAPAPPPIVPYSWTGFYVGVNAGYTWGPWDASSNQIIFDPSATHDAKVNGGLVGLQAGYNWQAGGWVYGLEGDIQYTGAKETDAWTDPGAPPIIITAPPILTDFLPGPAGGGPMFFSHEWKFPWFGTFRARLGVLPAERWLLYLTGGLAFGEAKYNMTFSQPGAVRLFNPYFLSDSVTRVGWTVGAGVESAFANNWSAKLEYLYVDLGTRSIDTLDVDGFPFHVEYKIRNNIVRVGLNYKLW